MNSSCEYYMRTLVESIIDVPDIETAIIFAENVTIKFKDGSILKLEMQE